MAGLSVLLETQNNLNKNPQIINKFTVLTSHPPPSPSPSPPPPPRRRLPKSPFLETCFLCRKRLPEGKDIYMYRGDRAFCSVECRCRQIFMDEESVRRDNNCSVTTTAAAASSPSHRSRVVVRAAH